MAKPREKKAAIAQASWAARNGSRKSARPLDREGALAPKHDLQDLAPYHRARWAPHFAPEPGQHPIVAQPHAQSIPQARHRPPRRVDGCGAPDTLAKAKDEY